MSNFPNLSEYHKSSAETYLDELLDHFTIYFDAENLGDFCDAQCYETIRATAEYFAEAWEQGTITTDTIIVNGQEFKITEFCDGDSELEIE